MMTTGGPSYIPHLRRWVTWKYDTDDWPFVPLTEPETEERRDRRMESLGYVLRYGQHWLEVPRPGEPEYAEYHRKAVEDWLCDMADRGWWDLDELRPIPKAIQFKAADFPANATMAHVMHRAGLFASVGEARRNGWSKPITAGDYVVGRKRWKVRVLTPDCATNI